MNHVFLTHSRGRRRGGVYVIVLGVALMVGVIGLTAVKIAQIELRSAVATNDAARARLMAQSAIAMALSHIDLAGDSWRSVYEHGAEVPPNDWMAVGDTGEFKYVLLDSSDDGDEDLADNSEDHVTIRGIGRAGVAMSIVTVTYAPDGVGLDCLASTVHAQDDVSVGGLLDSSEIEGEGVVTAGDTISVSLLSSVEQDTDEDELRKMPHVTHVFDYYLLNGTAIDIDDINSRKIERCVIGPGINPYGCGRTNPLGIYVIDCEGESLEIEDARIHGTLVILNAADGVRLDKQLNWTPAVDGLPALLLDGDMEFRWEGNESLSESATNVNFNPPGAPDESGDTDPDTGDSYESIIRGLVYISGNLSVTEWARVEGCVVVGGDCDVNGTLYATHRDAYLDKPPPGFANGESMSIIPGSWRREAY